MPEIEIIRRKSNYIPAGITMNLKFCCIGKNFNVYQLGKFGCNLD